MIITLSMQSKTNEGGRRQPVLKYIAKLFWCLGLTFKVSLHLRETRGQIL